MQDAPPPAAGKVKRPATAYSRYVADNFNAIAEANPDTKGVGQLGKLLGKQWSELPESEKVNLVLLCIELHQANDNRGWHAKQEGPCTAGASRGPSCRSRTRQVVLLPNFSICCARRHQQRWPSTCSTPTGRCYFPSLMGPAFDNLLTMQNKYKEAAAAAKAAFDKEYPDGPPKPPPKPVKKAKAPRAPSAYNVRLCSA